MAGTLLEQQQMKEGRGVRGRVVQIGWVDLLALVFTPAVVAWICLHQLGLEPMPEQRVCVPPHP